MSPKDQEDSKNHDDQSFTGNESNGQQAGMQEADMDFILDIPLELSVELGKTTMLVSDLLKLGQGSIVDLNKPAGEPLEISVNGKLVARGEVVVVESKYGIRLTDIVTPVERVKSLN
mgnify:CR=1 FL=1